MSARMSALGRPGSAPGRCSRACRASGPSPVRSPSSRLSRVALARPKSRILTTVLLAVAREHQIARLDVAVDHALLVGVLKAQRRLVARSSRRVPPAAARACSTILARSSPSTYSIAKTSSSPSWQRRCRRVTTLACLSFGRRSGSRGGSVRPLPGFSSMLRWPTTLSTSCAVHQRVPGQVDDAHAAAAQLAEHLVLRVVASASGPLPRECALWPCRAAAISVELRARCSRFPWGVLGREFGDPPSTGRATPKMFVNGAGRGIRKVPHPVGSQRRVGRMGRGARGSSVVSSRWCALRGSRSHKLSVASSCSLDLSSSWSRSRRAARPSRPRRDRRAHIRSNLRCSHDRAITIHMIHALLHVQNSSLIGSTP